MKLIPLDDKATSFHISYLDHQKLFKGKMPKTVNLFFHPRIRVAEVEDYIAKYLIEIDFAKDYQEKYIPLHKIIKKKLDHIINEYTGVVKYNRVKQLAKEVGAEYAKGTTDQLIAQLREME